MIKNFFQILFDDQPIQLTDDDKFSLQNTSVCELCNTPFSENVIKVRDHCHEMSSNNFRYVCCSNCNLKLRKSFIIPVVFHNLSNYDLHFLIEEFGSIDDGEMHVIPTTTEKYIGMVKKIAFTSISFKFIDSFRFLNASLDRITSSMHDDDFYLLKSEYSDKFSLVRRKGIMCYNYLDNPKKLKQDKLPPKSDFYNKLMECEISDEDYKHAQEVWKTFEIKNLGEYVKLYMKIDVFLLVDAFEEFRRFTIKNYTVDPAHFYTFPGYSWEIMLKLTRVKLELLTDVDQYMFIESGIRGGFSGVSLKYAESNNIFMKNYNPSIPSSYLIQVDVNNLYGSILTSDLPISEFTWVSINNLEELDPLYGYILEVDIDYPSSLHDEHADFPLLTHHYAPDGKKYKKLMATLLNQKNYVIYYKYLQYCISKGLILRKIHRVFRFNESPWLELYIEKNTILRREMTDEYKRTIPKLANNAIFGKSIENVRKRMDLKIVKSFEGRYGAEYFISKPNYLRHTIFTENLVAVQMKRLSINLNKPIYVGQVCLDLAKLHMCRFYYDFMRKIYTRDELKLAYTDTDSFLMYITGGPNIYDVIRDNPSQFDTSNFPLNNKFNIVQQNKGELGIMKVENAEKVMTHFVGLRSKMYAYKFDDGSENKRAKGIKKYIVDRTISFQDYYNCLMNEEIISRFQNLIQSKNHRIYTIRSKKKALDCEDDKRVMISKFTSLPYGHYSLNKNLP